MFIDFLLQHDMAEVSKIIEKTNGFLMFLKFWLLCCSDDLLIDLCWIFDRFGGRKSIKNLSKIDQKEIKKKMRCGMDFRWLLERSWGDLGPKLGAKLGPSWDENPKNGSSKTMSKNVL